VTVLNGLSVLQDNKATGISNQAVYTGSYSVADVIGETPGELTGERTQAVVMRGICLL